MRVETDDEHHEEQHDRPRTVEPTRGTRRDPRGGRLLGARPRPSERRLGGGDGDQPGGEVEADGVDERQETTEARRTVTSALQHVFRISRQLYTQQLLNIYRR